MPKVAQISDEKKYLLVTTFREAGENGPEPSNMPGRDDDQLARLSVKPRPAWQFLLIAYCIVVIGGGLLTYRSYVSSSLLAELLPAPVVESARSQPLPATREARNRARLEKAPAHTFSSRQQEGNHHKGPVGRGPLMPAPGPQTSLPVVNPSVPSSAGKEADKNPSEHVQPPILIKEPPPMAPPPAASPASIPDSGEVVWSGRTDSAGRINVGASGEVKGMLTGGLPGVPVTISVSPKSIGVVEGPSPSNNYKGLVLRGPVGKEMTVMIRWTRLK